MEMLYHNCGASVLHAVRNDGLEYFHDFRHPEQLYELLTCPCCGTALHKAMVEGALTPQPQDRDSGDEQVRVAA